MGGFILTHHLHQNLPRPIPTAIGVGKAAAAAAVAYALPPFTNNKKNPNYSSNLRSRLIGLVVVQHQHHHQHHLGCVAAAAAAALPMDSPSSICAEDLLTTTISNPLPELLTEYMVDMQCEACANAVNTALYALHGVNNVQIDLTNQIVRVLASSPLNIMTQALHHTGRKARLIGQGLPQDFLVSAAVAEFKGPQVFGVVRLVQVSMELARIEANFSGLSPGKHGWSINEYGDLTKGAASTGKVFNPTIQDITSGVLGDLGTLDVDEKGEAYFSGSKPMLRVSDLIGRSVVVYGTKDKSDAGITAAVIARSAAVGENYKKLCTCDGTTIWESTNNDFVASKV